MEVNPNRKPIKVFKAGTFGGTYFENIYCCVKKKMLQKFMERI